MAMCRYLVADGRHCSEEAGEHDLCHWHDPHHTHQEAHTAEALEQYVRAGGLCHGLQLSRANLAGLNLVNKESDQGFLLEAVQPLSRQPARWSPLRPAHEGRQPDEGRSQ